MELEIIYTDSYLCVINKPHGLAVHKSKLVRNAKELAVDLVRGQTGRSFNPIHRLDRKTSGLLLFCDDSNVFDLLRQQFEKREVIKTYLAIVRGYMLQPITVSKALINAKGQEQDAETTIVPLATSELPIPLGKHSTSRYSLVKVFPKTGRQHQIRKHLNHLRHPIIGDRPHGCNKQNRLFKKQWDLEHMLLHAYQLEFRHPKSGLPLSLKAPLSASFKMMMEALKFSDSLIGE